MVEQLLEARVVSLKIYLSTGSEWKDAFTGKKYNGGQTIDYKIKNIPIFTKNNFDFSLNKNK